jgi:acetolactate synthase-1/2/3 large subunit
MTGAQAAIEQLAVEGVEVVLGIPGIHTLHLCDAVLDHPEMEFITGRHEQGSTFIANGYARASGKIAVPIVITGPGVTNSVTPLADAYADSVPMVLIAAKLERGLAGKGAFHELKDQTQLLASVTKWNAVVEHVEEIPEAIRVAFSQAYAGRPGPTAVEIPLDLQAEQGLVDIHPRPEPERREADPSAVAEAARRLSGAARPLLFIGGGAAMSGCRRELIELMKEVDALSFTTVLAKGIIPDDHERHLGSTWDQGGPIHEVFESADTILVIGSSLDEAGTRAWRLPLSGDLIQIDTSPDVIGRNYPAAVALVGDAKAVLRQLLRELRSGAYADGLEKRDRGWGNGQSSADLVADIKRRKLKAARGEIGWQYMSAMQEALPRDAFVTNDAAEANGWAIRYLNSFLPRTVNITGNMAALGYAIPGAIGAKLAYPDRQAVAVIGDGGFLFTAYTLATAVQHRLNAVVVVFDNSCYNTVGRGQEAQFGRRVGVDLINPDFVRLAEAHGAFGARANKPEDLHDALMAAWARDLPTVIEVPLTGRRS